jgi:hypothetical protein
MKDELTSTSYPHLEKCPVFLAHPGYPDLGTPPVWLVKHEFNQPMTLVGGRRYLQCKRCGITKTENP